MMAPSGEANSDDLFLFDRANVRETLLNTEQIARRPGSLGQFP
jgi:hypothetical protein